MNKNAVAMAADSAVTVGNHSAVYNSVDKLFQLSNVAPVGLLFYGRAELMGAPLEIIVSEYKKYLGNKTFSSLNQYVDDFCEYIEQNSQYFMFEKYEKEYIYYFCNGFLREIKRRFSDYIEQCQNSEKPSYDLVINGLNKIFMDYLNDFDKYEKLETSFAEYARDKYSDFLKSEIIDNENIDFLNTNQKKILCEKVFTLLDTKFSFGDTGIAIAGYGEKEIYPHLCNFSLDAVLNGKIRLISKDECEISDSPSAIISPFAQRDIIDNILTGIDYTEHNLLTDIPSYVCGGIDSMDDSLFASGKKHEVISNVYQGVCSIISHVIKKINERNDIMDSVAMLPTPELASLAESLINITSILRKVKIDELNATVGGPIDVFVISKRDGLVWMKKKNCLCNEDITQY